MAETIIYKGYSENGIVWAIGKNYGGGETETKFICEVSANEEIMKEYERQKNVFNNRRKEARGTCGDSASSK